MAIKKKITEERRVIQLGTKASASVTIADISDGINGTGIKSTVVEYQAGASGTTAPTGTWKTTVDSTSAAKPYLWTRVTYTYTDGSSPKIVYSVGSTPEGAVETSKNYTDTQVEIVSNALDASMDVIVGTQTAVTGSWTGKAKFSELKDGQRIAYWLPYNGSGNATLNLTLSNGSTTGAIACYYSGTSRITTHYSAGNVIHLTYKKNISIAGSSTKYTGWWADANYDSGNTYDRTRYVGTIKAGSTAIVAGNIIVAKDGTYTHLKLGNVFDVSYPILYASSPISVSSTGSNNYLIIPFAVTTTQNITLTPYKPVYIKGKLSGTLFTPVSTTPLTQTVPTSEDGYQYILLGTAYSSTAMYLLNEHPIFQYYNGAFKTVQQIAIEASEAAKEAAKTATNYMNFDDTGLVIGNLTGEVLGRNVLIDLDSVDIRNGDTVLASYGDNYIYLGKNSKDTIIDLSNGSAKMYHDANNEVGSRFVIESEKEIYLKTPYRFYTESEYEGGNGSGQSVYSSSFMESHAGYMDKDGNINSSAYIRLGTYEYNNTTSTETIDASIIIEDGIINLTGPDSLGNTSTTYLHLDTKSGTVGLRGYTSIDLSSPKIYVSNDLDVLGGLTVNGGIVGKSCIEVYGSPAYIDFHGGNSAADYTSRIADWNDGWLRAYAINGVSVEQQLSVTGTLTCGGEIRSNYPNGLRLAFGDYGFIIRNDGGAVYFMATNAGDPLGGWSRYSYMLFSSGRWVFPYGMDVGDEIVSMGWYNNTNSNSPNAVIGNQGRIRRSTASSRRYKTNILPVTEPGLNPHNLYNLPVCQYNYIPGYAGDDPLGEKLHIGFIAEDVADIYPIAAEYNEDGTVEMWNFKEIIPPMLSLIQEQHNVDLSHDSRITELETQVKILYEQLTEAFVRIEQLKNQIAS